MRLRFGRRDRVGLLVLLLALSSMLAVSLTSGVWRADGWHGLAANRPAPDFRLRDHQGRQVSLRDFRGRFLYLMFGYLNCRDVCHTQALMLQQLLARAERPAQLVFVFVGMDPARDSPQRLAAYFDARGEQFVSLNAASLAQAQQLAVAYRVPFARRGDSRGDDYAIQHPAHLLLLGPDGRVRLRYASGLRHVEPLLEDLRRLRELYRDSDQGTGS
jgi:protein SCO1/2